MTRRARAIPRHRITSKRLVTLAALLAFFLQCLAVQTHIHQLTQLQTASVVAADVPAPTPLKGQDPIDQSGCRLCQELLHSSVFVAPAVAILPASQALVIAAFVALPAFTAAWAPAFAWRSRAPPRH
ncbi:MAG TPA: hypothetical protein VGM26_03510 [Rhizomicrobium sp.]|jgi:hypothetical protein